MQNTSTSNSEPELEYMRSASFGLVGRPSTRMATCKRSERKRGEGKGHWVLAHLQLRHVEAVVAGDVTDIEKFCRKLQLHLVRNRAANLDGRNPP